MHTHFDVAADIDILAIVGVEDVQMFPISLFVVIAIIVGTVVEFS